MILSCGFCKRASFDKAHRVERSLLGLTPVLVHRHDARVFEVPSDAGFPLKSGPEGFIGCRFWPKLFQCYFPIELVIVRQPNASSTTCSMEADQGITLCFIGRNIERYDGAGRSSVRRRITERLTYFDVV